MSDYVGTYADPSGHPVEVVAGDEFFAFQDTGFTYETKFMNKLLRDSASVG
jgi:hypothetical protein